MWVILFWIGYFCTGTVRGWSSPAIPSMKKTTTTTTSAGTSSNSIRSLSMTDNDYTWICYYYSILLWFKIEQHLFIYYLIFAVQLRCHLCAPYLVPCWLVGPCSVSAAKWPSLASVFLFVSASSLWDSHSTLNTRHNSTSAAFSLVSWTVLPLLPHKFT